MSPQQLTKLMVMNCLQNSLTCLHALSNDKPDIDKINEHISIDIPTVIDLDNLQGMYNKEF